MKEEIFGYKCSECGEGIVKSLFLNTSTTSPSSAIGACDRCGAQHFAPRGKRMNKLNTKAMEEVFKCLESAKIKLVGFMTVQNDSPEKQAYLEVCEAIEWLKAIEENKS